MWLAAVTLFIIPLSSLAQLSDKVSKVNVGAVHPGDPLSIQVEFVSANVVDRIEIAFRQFGERDFRRVEMLVAGNSATVTIPPVFVVPPSLEYYFVLYLHGQTTTENYPIENPEQHPLSLTISEAESTKRAIVILSPEENEKVQADDVLISFSLVNDDSSINRAATKVYLDAADLSTNYVRSEDLFVIKPENVSSTLSSGPHTVRVEIFDTQGKPVDTYSWQFTVNGTSEIGLPPVSSVWKYNYNIQLETRNEDISSEVRPYNRATISANGTYNQFRLNGRVYVTNEEQDNRQPQNRFFIGGESPWFNVGYGDSYPIFPDLIMNGRRVRGFNGKLTFGKFNLDVTTGNIIRRIESTVFKTFPESTLAVEQANDPTGAFGLYDPTTNPRLWAKYNYGTFNRTLFAIRPSFGKREESHIGFSYLKSTDDIGSIRFGIKPQENVVLGSDLVLTLDRRNIEITGQGAFSATNKDITNGSFSDSLIDILYKDYDESYRNRIRNIRDAFSGIITVNEHLTPLGVKNLPTLAYEGGLSLNYFNNALRFTYLRHGEGYESFGQSFLRTDVRGYNISDRIRLANNQWFLSAGFERLKDNTAETKATTTTGTTGNVSLSYFSRSSAPNVTLSYLHASNVNERPITDSLYAIDDRTDRVLVQLGKEFTFGARHTTLLSVSTSMRDDRSYRDLDTRNTTVMLSAISTFTIPLQTVTSLTINSSKFVSSFSSAPVGGPASLTYTTLSTTALYRLMEDRLQLSGSFSPTFGDIQRVLVDATAQYYVMKNLSVRSQLSLYLNQKFYQFPGSTNDVIWSLILRADV